MQAFLNWLTDPRVRVMLAGILAAIVVYLQQIGGSIASVHLAVGILTTVSAWIANPPGSATSTVAQPKQVD